MVLVTSYVLLRNRQFWATAKVHLLLWKRLCEAAFRSVPDPCGTDFVCLPLKPAQFRAESGLVRHGFLFLNLLVSGRFTMLGGTGLRMRNRCGKTRRSNHLSYTPGR